MPNNKQQEYLENDVAQTKEEIKLLKENYQGEKFVSTLSKNLKESDTLHNTLIEVFIKHHTHNNEIKNFIKGIVKDYNENEYKKWKQTAKQIFFVALPTTLLVNVGNILEVIKLIIKK